MKVERARPSGQICILSGTSNENRFKRASHIGFDCIVFAVTVVCICTCKFYQRETCTVRMAIMHRVRKPMQYEWSVLRLLASPPILWRWPQYTLVVNL